MEALLSLHPALLALIGGLFTWFCTIVGSAPVFFFKEVNRKLLDAMMGFAAGVMIAASFWSLLEPSLAFSKESGATYYWLPTLVGFLFGGGFLRVVDYIVPHLHLNKPIEEAEGLPIKKGLSKTMLLFLAITIHNFPEGLAVGVAFGALASVSDSAAMLPLLMSAVGLTLGIGLQNVPEGAALSMPLRAEGKSRMSAFLYGSFSAIVEPIGAVLGALFVISMTSILPYALAFAAGAMIFVVVEELIPESQSNGNTDLATLSLMIGFSLMMVLDVVFG